MTWILEAFWDGERDDIPTPKRVVEALGGQRHVVKVSMPSRDMVRMELEDWSRAGQVAMDGAAVIRGAFPDLELEELTVRRACLS